MGSNFSRRDFLAGSAGLASASLVPLIGALRARHAMAQSRVSMHVAGPYGPLHAVTDLSTGLPLIMLPQGFQYRTYSWSGDPMRDRAPTPEAHDGMGVIAASRRGGEIDVVLVRNHERAIAAPIVAPARYDTVTPKGESLAPGGGTTTLRFRGRRWTSVEPSLGGTIYNCAGGVTPWGTWLSCEETIMDLTDQGGRRHGYVFEVRRNPRKTTGRPIVDMGWMLHEAVAVDPATRIAYLTEDHPRNSGFYRFLPNDASGKAGSYEAGGRLQAARVIGRANADLAAPALGEAYRIDWVEIGKPDADPGAAPAQFGADGSASGPFLEGWSKGSLRLSRAEGICRHGGKFYLVDTEAGFNAEGQRGHGDGAVWEYDPRAQTLRAIFVAASQQVGDNIDNITASPRGGMLLCENGDPVTDAYGPGTRLLGLTAGGESYTFAKNRIVLTQEQLGGAGKRVSPDDYRGQEWAGACFDPWGEVLFVNIQVPGISFAIWGPWERGNL